MALPIGKNGEQVATNYLLAQGYEIIERNYFNQKGYKQGEIDIIAKDKYGWLVFVEVKSRRGNRGKVLPEENLTAKKLDHIFHMANRYLAQKKLLGINWRVDLVAVIFDFDIRKIQIRHIKSVRH